MTAQDPYSSFVPDLRPASYADHLDVVSAILSGIKGEQRRRNLQETLQERGEVAPASLVPTLAADVRGHLAIRDPRWLGGELLPPDLPGETTIARICFNTITWHVIEIRALRRVDRYTYRIVDELGTEFHPLFDVSRLPLTFLQLIELIDGSCEMTGERGLVFPVLATVFPSLRSPSDCRGEERAGDRSALIDAVRDFVTVTSDLYPQLDDYYMTRVDEKLADLGYLHTFHRRSREIPDLYKGPSTPQEQSISRLFRAWQRSLSPARSLGQAKDGWKKSKTLKKYLQDCVASHGTLPAGVVRPTETITGWTVDIDELTETGELIERVLAEGRELIDPEPAWLGGAGEHVAILEFGERLYIAHADDLDGPFAHAGDVEDFYLELLHERGELIVQLDWDSGGPGAGAGVVSAYRLFGLLFITNDVGINGPLDDYEESVRGFGLYMINGATTRIWDAEHGVVFERGILHRPDVVERYGEIRGEVEYSLGPEVTEDAPMSCH